MNILRRFWKWQCNLALKERGLWLLGAAVFTFLLGLILASGDWEGSFMYSLGYSDIEVGDVEIPLKHWTAFSLLLGAGGIGMFFAGRKGMQ